VQAEIANRCIELLSLPEGKSSYILDVGCGSGLSGQALEEAGHVWVGCDISPSMLEVAVEQVCVCACVCSVGGGGRVFMTYGGMCIFCQFFFFFLTVLCE
jgi:SAM-dependent methyltransferase